MAMKDPSALDVQALIVALRKRCTQFNDVLAVIPEQAAAYRPAHHEWSIKEVIGHVGDTVDLFTSHITHIVAGKREILRHYDEKQMVRERCHQNQPFSQLIARVNNLHQKLELVLLALPLQAWTMSAEHEQWKSTSVYQLVSLLSAHYHTHTVQIQHIHQNYLQTNRAIHKK
jgi:hypothetical protein